MPGLLLRACTGSAGCPNLTAKGPCTECRTKRDRADRDTRGTSAERGYDRRWLGFRRWWLNKILARGVVWVCGARWPGQPATGDSRCQAAGVLEGRDIEVDHVQPFKRADGSIDERKRFSELNLQILCRPCHSSKTVREDGGFGRRKGAA